MLEFAVLVLGIISIIGTFLFVSYIAKYFGSYSSILNPGWSVRRR